MSSTAAYRQFLQDLEEKRGWCPLTLLPVIAAQHVTIIKTATLLSCLESYCYHNDNIKSRMLSVVLYVEVYVWCHRCDMWNIHCVNQHKKIFGLGSDGVTPDFQGFLSRKTIRQAESEGEKGLKFKLGMKFLVFTFLFLFWFKNASPARVHS